MTEDAADASGEDVLRVRAGEILNEIQRLVVELRHTLAERDDGEDQ